jgi:diaminopimelate decarboxylase
MGEGVLTAGFTRVDGSLWCEGVALEDVARAAGTPAYVYSTAAVRDRYEKLEAMLTRAGVPHRVHYTLKANANLAVLRLLKSLGAGADVVSGGELERALRAGFAADRIVFGGVGKTDDELQQAIRAGVLMINVESEAELRRLDEIARDARVTAPIGLRVNPGVSLHAAHDYIKTGEKAHKFGIELGEAAEAGRLAASLRNVRLVGLDMHLGSQLSRIEPYKVGTERLLKLHDELKAAGVSTIKYLDIGGGLGVRYDSEKPPDLKRFAEMVVKLIAPTGLTLIMEPGRFIVGNAGALLTTVLYRKRNGGKEFIVTDAGMTELLRPSHYGAFHRIEAVDEHEDTVVGDVVGPVCETGDFLALDRQLGDVQPGERLLVYDVGAYGYVMASNYNARRRAAEVLVDGDRFAIVTRRETYDDLMRLDVPEPQWTTPKETQE